MINWLIGPMVLITLWYLILLLGVLNPFFLPYPHTIVKDLYSLFVEKQLLNDLIASFLRTISGFMLSAIWGIVFGIIIGYYVILNKAFISVVDFFRSIPATALIPLSILLFTKSEIARIFVVTFSCGLIVLVNTSYGVRNSSKTRKEVAFLFKANTYQIFKQVIFKESLISIFSGLRITLSLSLVLVVVGEMFIGTDIGLGQKIFDYQIMNETSKMYAIILLTGILGYLLNNLFIRFERYIIHWKM